jgi:TonB family protein
MSKPRLVLRLPASVALIILAAGVCVCALPVRAPAQATATGTQPAEKETPVTVFASFRPVRQVTPVYPPGAKEAGIQGAVKLRVAVGKDGNVTDIRVLSGPRQLAKAALEAVVRWHYSPSDEARLSVVTIVFTLPRGGVAPPPRVG